MRSTVFYRTDTTDDICAFSFNFSCLNTDVSVNECAANKPTLRAHLLWREVSRGVVSRQWLCWGGKHRLSSAAQSCGWIKQCPIYSTLCRRDKSLSTFLFHASTLSAIATNVGISEGWSPDLTAAVGGFLPSALSSGESLCGITVAIFSFSLLFSPKPVLPCTWPLPHHSSSLFSQCLSQRGQGHLTLSCCCWDWCWLWSPPPTPLVQIAAMIEINDVSH